MTANTAKLDALTVAMQAVPSHRVETIDSGCHSVEASSGITCTLGTALAIPAIPIWYGRSTVISSGETGKL